ncbi:MAG: flagellar export protein FliJ [Desulfobacterales bacterium]|nr:flagellar export protein FliJ [Desulfobacterales bacterium]MBU8911515.1 flagellar export protein FliJ [Desulfobacterales bacterium]
MFNFNLQPVLDYRKQLEEKLMLEFAEIKRLFNCEKETLKKLKKERAGLIFQLRKMGENRLSAADASNYLSYITRIKDDENHREKIICKIEKELKEKRSELVDASKKKRILEILKEKKLKEYRLSLISREQKELDESWLLRFDRSVKNEEVNNCL